VNHFSPDTRAQDPSQATPAEGPLARIESLLQEQWQQVREGNIDAAHDLGQRVDALIAHIGAPTGDLADTETRLRLARLCDKIGLALAQRAAEIAERRARLRAGRSVRKAYGRGRTG